jgi:hypothetical protein
MKNKILTVLICFVVGVLGYYLYENNFSLSSKIEKCADAKIPEKKKFIELDKQNKLSVLGYREHWAACENEAKKYPELFKTRY